MSDILQQERCPNCHLPAEVKSKDDEIWLECEQDGHIGVPGRTMDQAIFNWNVYIRYVVKTETASNGEH